MEQKDFCVDQKLLNEVCFITTPKQTLVGKISKIYSDKFAVTILPLVEDNNIENSRVEIRIETLDNEVYFYVALVDSQHLLTNHRIVFFKPVSQIHEKNKRKSQRFKVESYMKPVHIDFRQFPPIDSKWLKGKLIDISQGGIQIKSEHYFSRGQLIEIKIGQPFFYENEIIISRILQSKEENQEYVSSIQFLNLSDNHKEKIGVLIETMQKNIRKIAKANRDNEKDNEKI